MCLRIIFLSQVDNMVILGLVDCILEDGEPFDVKLTRYQGTMVCGHGMG